MAPIGRWNQLMAEAQSCHALPPYGAVQASLSGGSLIAAEVNVTACSFFTRS